MGPFKVKIPCGECTLTSDTIKDVLANELAGVPVELEVKDWLSHVIEACRKGAKTKAALDVASIGYTYHDVVRNPGAMDEMISPAKAVIGPKKTVTTPQVSIDLACVGGHVQLVARIGELPADAFTQSNAA